MSWKSIHDEASSGFRNFEKSPKTYTHIRKPLPSEHGFRINVERILKADDTTQSLLMTSALGPHLASLPLYTSPSTLGWRHAAADV
jgi:hypothetical protein